MVRDTSYLHTRVQPRDKKKPAVQPQAGKRQPHLKSNSVLQLEEASWMLLPNMMRQVMPTVGSKVPAGICGQQPTLVPCRAHRVPCVVMECQAAVRATNDLRCGSWALLSGQSKGQLELELEQLFLCFYKAPSRISAACADLRLMRPNAQP